MVAPTPGVLLLRVATKGLTVLRLKKSEEELNVATENKEDRRSVLGRTGEKGKIKSLHEQSFRRVAGEFQNGNLRGGCRENARVGGM
jgi:hypothetical protein